jgi:hypothetical protein
LVILSLEVENMVIVHEGMGFDEIDRSEKRKRRKDRMHADAAEAAAIAPEVTSAPEVPRRLRPARRSEISKAVAPALPPQAAPELDPESDTLPEDEGEEGEGKRHGDDEGTELF